MTTAQNLTRTVLGKSVELLAGLLAGQDQLNSALQSGLFFILEDCIWEWVNTRSGME